jgi:hypothetical protein
VRAGVSLVARERRARGGGAPVHGRPSVTSTSRARWEAFLLPFFSLALARRERARLRSPSPPDDGRGCCGGGRMSKATRPRAGPRPCRTGPRDEIPRDRPRPSCCSYPCVNSRIHTAPSSRSRSRPRVRLAPFIFFPPQRRCVCVCARAGVQSHD